MSVLSCAEGSWEQFETLVSRLYVTAYLGDRLHEEVDGVLNLAERTESSGLPILTCKPDHDQLPSLAPQETVMDGKVPSPSRPPVDNAERSEARRYVNDTMLVLVLRKIADTLLFEGIRLAEITSKQSGNDFINARALDEVAVALSNSEVFTAKSNRISGARRTSVLLAGEEIASPGSTATSTIAATMEAKTILRHLEETATDFGALVFETKLINQHLAAAPE